MTDTLAAEAILQRIQEVRCVCAVEAVGGHAGGTGLCGSRARFTNPGEFRLRAANSRQRQKARQQGAFTPQDSLRSVFALSWKTGEMPQTCCIRGGYPGVDDARWGRSMDGKLDFTLASGDE